MPQRDKSANTDEEMRQGGAIEKGHEQKSAARPEAEGRTWPAVKNLHGGGNKFGSRQKVAFGPVGGSGRKTNASRSS
jgi:hypothetical protein